MPATMVKKSLGERIRKAREALGLSQREVAKRAGISHVQWARVESDENSPTVDTLKKIASALECDVKDLLP
jgi:transcriptional regulator with XRE-family HTH domain